MKKIILLLAIAILAVQLVAAPNNVPSESVTAKLIFGNINLPSGIVTGYNLTMQNDALLSVFGIQSKAVYFVVGDEPAFYQKTTENNILLFEVPVQDGVMATTVTDGASDIAINGLPYIFAFGDRLQFDLNVNFDGSLYSILFGRLNSDNAITVGDNSGMGLFLYNDNSGSLVLLKDNNNLINENLLTEKTVTFRAPRAAGGENNAEAEARRIERAGARVEVNVGSCIDLDNAGGSNIPLLGEAHSGEYFGKQVTVVTINANSAVIRVGSVTETLALHETKTFGGLKITLDMLVPLGAEKRITLIIHPENEYAWSSYGYDESGTFLSDFCAEDVRTGRQKLNEVKCVSNRVSLEEHNCAANEVCRNGACVQEQQQEVAFCYDSDKDFDDITIGNKNQMDEAFSSKGVVAGFYAAGRDITYGLWDDSCATSNKLVEYYCRNSKTRFITVVCGSGCSEGKCVNPPYCVDSDGGENERIKGTVVAITARNQNDLPATSNEDVCIDNTEVREYACDTNGLQKDLIINCEFGCSEGRCLKADETPVVDDRTPCSTKSDCSYSQACIKTGSASASLQISNSNAAEASPYTFNELETKTVFGKTVKLETIGANNVVVTVDGESKTINLNGAESINNFIVSLTSIQQKEGFCDKCTRSQECGSGSVCSVNRCRPASGRCQTDTNCKIGKYCSPRQGQMGFCENERLSTLDDISAALTRRWKRVNVYARIIVSSELLHSLTIPPKVANEQSCLVDNQCRSNECDPDTGKCTGAESNANPDWLDPDTPGATGVDLTSADSGANFWDDAGAGSNFRF